MSPRGWALRGHPATPYDAPKSRGHQSDATSRSSRALAVARPTEESPTVEGPETNDIT